MSGQLNLALPSGGSVTVAAPDSALDTTVTLPAGNNTLGIQGPAFSAYYAGASQSVTTGTFTKVLFDTELFDTNNNFASSRFTPNVAGYYQINATLSFGGSTTRCLASLYKNGTEYARGTDISVTTIFKGSVSAVVYLNGSTDYIEVYCYMLGTSLAINADVTLTQVSGALVRAA